MDYKRHHCNPGFVLSPIAIANSQSSDIRTLDRFSFFKSIHLLNLLYICSETQPLSMSDTTLDPVRKPFAKGRSSPVRNNNNKGKKPTKGRKCHVCQKGFNKASKTERCRGCKETFHRR